MIKSGKQKENLVLIVDDSPENRLLLTSQLSMEGYKIVQAQNGHEGLQMAREHDPDIILLDVMMPDINGFTVCRQLKESPTTHPHSRYHGHGAARH
ncbi:MAG: response regulator [Chloroflexi bacterium]|nr:response regulator [Chloroflexota bacterium]